MIMEVSSERWRLKLLVRSARIHITPVNFNSIKSRLCVILAMAMTALRLKSVHPTLNRTLHGTWKVQKASHVNYPSSCPGKCPGVGSGATCLRRSSAEA